MRGCKNKYTNIWSAARIFRMLGSAGLLMVVSAAVARAQATDPAAWIPVSMNAGETYVINDIKPGTKPAFQVQQNPNAFVSYDSPPGKLTLLSAGAGRWQVTVTNNSDRAVTYDVNAFGVAKRGSPLTPGNAPPSMTDDKLDSRPHEASSTSISPGVPELGTISSLRTTPSAASSYT